MTDAPAAGLDACAAATAADFARAGREGVALPTFAFTHAAPAAVVGAVTDVVTRHFNSDMSSEDAVRDLVEAVAAVR